MKDYDIDRRGFLSSAGRGLGVAAVEGYSTPSASPAFNEFVVRASIDAETVLAKLRGRNIIGGLALSRYYPERPNDLLVAVTETNTREQIDALADALAEAR